MSGHIERVFVRKGTVNLFYVCQQYWQGYWKCGKCGRGNLGFLPKKGDSCRVCKSKVVQVVTDATINISVSKN